MSVITYQVAIVCTMLLVSAWPGHTAAGHGQQDEAQKSKHGGKGVCMCAAYQNVGGTMLLVPRLAALLQDTASRVSTLV
jgi:hypothetical protein